MPQVGSPVHRMKRGPRRPAAAFQAGASFGELNVVIAPSRPQSGFMQQSPEPPASFQFGAPFNLAKLTETMGVIGHSSWLGMRYHAEGEDWIELAIPWKAELTADRETGVLASGPIISMMDNATGMAVWKKRGVLLPQVTVDLRIDYMRAARPGCAVVGRGECYKLTRNFAFVRGVAYDEDIDDPVAHVVGRFILVDEARP
jgi:uncharacterized protein (TIGR00369 family)